VAAPPTDAAFSAARAFGHVQRVALEPHAIGTAENERVRAYIVNRLRALRLEPELQTSEAPDYYGGSAAAVPVVNVIARIPGTASTGAVLLVGHYDTVPTTAGANDDGSAVAIMLETARALRAGTRLRNDVVLLFSDGEEPAPRFGSSAFVSDRRWARDLGFVINLEAIGGGGPSTLVEISGPVEWIVNQYADAVQDPVAYSYLTTTSALIGGSNSDFASFS
jgi:Zn-dependent M28 family amino/carboxypeptidase